MSIIVENASKQFGDFVALDDVSIEVPDGSLTALLGPERQRQVDAPAGDRGARVSPTAGRVVISGRTTPRSIPAQNRGVGFVFQHYAAFKHMTVQQQHRLRPADPQARQGGDRRAGPGAPALVHLDGFADRYPSQLSGGQRQRMALARALAVEPKVLLLDEPFGALDANVRKELREWLRRLHDEVHVTTIFVTHDQEEAMEVAEQIVVMNDGQVEQTGPPRDLYEHPKTRVRDGLRRRRQPARRAVRPPARRRDPPGPGAGGRGGDDRADRPPRLRGPRRARPRRRASNLWAQITQAEAEQLELAEGQIVYVRPSRAKVFDRNGRPTTEELQAA